MASSTEQIGRELIPKYAVICRKGFGRKSPAESLQHAKDIAKAYIERGCLLVEIKRR